MIKGLIFDFGDTLIHQVPDNEKTLDELALVTFPSVQEALQKLCNSFKIAILSNTEATTSEQLNLALDKIGLGDLGIDVFTSISIGVKKPNKYAFVKVLEHFTLKPNEVVMVGNDLIEDIEGAQKVGLFTIFVSKEEIESNIKPDLRVSRVDTITPELLTVLGSKERAIPIKKVDHDNKAEKLALEAIELEREQEWRKIGMTWLKCGSELKVLDLTMIGEYIDPEATVHNFPQFDLAKWRALSQKGRAGRAFRYAGYHFEGDGDRQSAYRLYRASAKCFEEDKNYDEAGRSHFLALNSYIRRFGEIDGEFLKELENSTRISVHYDEQLYLKRMVIYYRILTSLLKGKGNFFASIAMRKQRKEAERLLLKKPKTFYSYILSTLWSFITGYGQGLSRWVITLIITTLLVFPTIYKWGKCLGEDVSFLKALIFSISRLTGHDIYNLQINNFGHFIIILQGLFIFFKVFNYT